MYLDSLSHFISCSLGLLSLHFVYCLFGIEIHVCNVDTLNIGTMQLLI